MQFGVCTPAANSAIAKAAGADFTEGHVQQFLRPADALWQKPLDPKTLPVPIAAYNCLLPADLKVTGPAVDMLKIKAYMARACKRCRETASSVLVFGSGGARNVPDGWPREKAEEQFVEVMRRPDGQTAVARPCGRAQGARGPASRRDRPQAVLCRAQEHRLRQTHQPRVLVGGPGRATRPDAGAPAGRVCGGVARAEGRGPR
ncbi:MAG: hypothetical protein NTX87_06770 [Planctomycetota bacterium]|nr:hypothetical protein [Planctomycetota bacterium]